MSLFSSVSLISHAQLAGVLAEYSQVDQEEDAVAPQPAELMPSTTQRPHAAIVAVVAIVAIAAVAAVALLHYKNASSAITVLGPVMGGISSIVAAYFGVRSGTLAMQKANEAEAIRKQPG